MMGRWRFAVPKPERPRVPGPNADPRIDFDTGFGGSARGIKEAAMAEKFIRETDSFVVTTGAGMARTVVELTNFHRQEFVGQPAQTLKGTRCYELTDGTPVNWIDDNTFENVDSGEVMRKL